MSSGPLLLFAIEASFCICGGTFRSMALASVFTFSRASAQEGFLECCLRKRHTSDAESHFFQFPPSLEAIAWVSFFCPLYYFFFALI